MNKRTLFLLLCVSLNGWTQSYAPAAGEPGSTAIHMSDSEIMGWATAIEVRRGFVNIEDTTIEAAGNNRATFGEPSFALGPASGNTADVVSLGDKGVAVVTFDQPIFNGTGFDFAVFENSFSDDFLELAHVEVSSDGVHFVRFPSHSEVQDQVQIHGFGSTDPKMIYNLAGKYRGNYGTPFDLQELEDSLSIDINNITHVKIIDVVGSVGDSATFDAYGNKINEPFSTPYESGGFDLEAVGVINQVADIEKESINPFNIYPNPSEGQFYIRGPLGEINKMLITSVEGKTVRKIALKPNQKNLSIQLPQGVYLIHYSCRGVTHSSRIIIR